MSKLNRVLLGVALALAACSPTTEAVVIVEHSDGSASAYRRDAVNRTWLDAQANASSKIFAGVTGQLATIANRDEQRWVQQVGTGDRWIGLTDNEAFGGTENGDQSLIGLPVAFSTPSVGTKGAGWTWVDGDAVRYQGWASFEPNNAGGDEDAALLRNDGQWNDDRFSANHPSIIEHELPALPDDVFAITLVKQYNGITNLSVADAVLAGDMPSIQTSGSFSVFDLLDSGDPGFVGVNQPVPGVSDADHFVSRSIAPLDVQAAGVFTFALISDDGGRLVLDGVTIAEFYGSRGYTSSISVPVELTAGNHELEVVWFDNINGAGAEIAYAAGAEGFLNTNFTLIGDPSKGIGLSAPINTTTFDVKLETAFGLAFGQGLTPVEAADLLLAGATPGVAWQYFSDVVNFHDLEESLGGDFFGDDDPFLGLMETDEDRFVLQATGFVEILNQGLYTFGMRFDDGARLRIDGIDVINEASQGDAFATLLLDRGFHNIELTMGDDGGRGTIELFAAAGQHASFDSQVFRLVGDTGNGGLRVTQTTGSIPEPASGLLMMLAFACMGRRHRSR